MWTSSRGNLNYRSPLLLIASAPADPAHDFGAQGHTVHRLGDHPGLDLFREVHLQAVPGLHPHHADAVDLRHPRQALRRLALRGPGLVQGRDRRT